ncbi:MAG: ATP-binding cassette domain-containing protein [Acidobacteria bacterium]|nr:ATP-binding cassette domain-containing protein [Acidobacteriota bacterium]
MIGSAIVVENLGKLYRIGSAQKRNQTFRDAMVESVRSSLGRITGRAEKDEKESTIWALRDISFGVEQGEVIGIIGANGAGKSTLLKILSRITEPTTGRAVTHGRVGSLLEVGTGFHPELTGRENIFLNGAILGMNKAQIRKKFDEIVAFSDVERFLETPVKRYSSGMYVRLAFAVAAHLEPDILLVDEVLAVGDMEFQKKCLGKMGEVGRQGRTVFFVSHSMQAISTLAKRTLLLEKGRCSYDGDTRRAISLYRSGFSQGDGNSYLAEIPPGRSGVVRAHVVTSEPGQVHLHGEPLVFEFEIQFGEKPKSGSFAFQILDNEERAIAFLWIFDSEKSWSQKGRVRLRCTLPEPRLYMGTYTLTTYLSDRASREQFERLTGICRFEIAMDNKPREYEWFPQACTYLETGEWSIEK